MGFALSKPLIHCSIGRIEGSIPFTRSVPPAANDLLHPCKPTPIPYKIAKPILAKNGLYT